MPSTLVYARDHLQRAAAILQGGDSQSRQIRHIIERTISLINDFEPKGPTWPANVLDLAAFREQRADLD